MTDQVFLAYHSYRKWLAVVLIITVVIYISFITNTIDYSVTNNAVHHRPKYKNFNRLMISLKTSTTPPNEKLVDLDNFYFKINNDICGKENIFIVSFIHSAPLNRLQRNSIREAWGNTSNLEYMGLKMRTVFLLAAVKDPKTQLMLEEENKKFHDIVQGNFIDAYRNLTYKQVMGMKWVAHFCPQAEFVLKSDDDTFIDIFQVAEMLKSRRGQKRLVLCNEWVGMPVLRDKKSKWYVSEEEYKPNVFSPYCSGWAFILTPDVAKGIDEVAPTEKFFWVDDAHVTGPLLDKIGVKRQKINSFFAFGDTEISNWAKDDKNMKPVQFIFATTWGRETTMKKVWAKTVAVHRGLSQ